jgi:hypothetical protein
MKKALSNLKSCAALLLFAVVAFWIPTGAMAQTATFYVPNTTQVVPTGSTAALAFGPVAIGASSGTQSITLTNTGASTLSSIAVATSGGNTGDFTITASATSPAVICGASASSLTAGSSCAITITFSPTATGVRTTTISVSSNATTVTFGVTGTGVFPGATQNTIPAAATVALTQAQCGSLVYVGAATGEVVTLPTPAAGCSFDFNVTVSNTSNYNEIETGSASIFLLGDVQHCATGIACLNFWANGTTSEAIKMDGAHLGGLIGSHFTVKADSSTVWHIWGDNLCTATCTTAVNATE